MSEALIIAIITIVTGAVGAVIWYVIKRFSERITDKIDEMIVELKKLTEQTITNTGHIDQHNNQLKDHSDRLNDHSKRLRTIELKQAGCHNCNK